MVKYRQIELCNLRDPKEAKFFSKLFYTCTHIDGETGIDPIINLFYFKNHGTKKQLEKAQKDYNEFSEKAEKIRESLEIKLKENPKLKETRSGIFYSNLGMKHEIIAKRDNNGQIKFYRLPFL